MVRGGRAQAAEGSGRLSQQLMPPAALLQALSEIRDVVLIVTADRTLLYANKAAERLLATRDPLLVRRGRLEATSGPLGKELGRAIDCACANHEREVAVLRRSSAPLLLVAITCLDNADGWVLLVAGDASVEPTEVVRPLRACFGLTQSEAEVAAAIAAGGSSSEIADRRGVSINTIRTQVKTIASKLGCVRQSQIGAIVRAVPLGSA